LPTSQWMIPRLGGPDYAEDPRFHKESGHNTEIFKLDGNPPGYSQFYL